MDLLNCSITPAIVTSSEDPDCLGRIKCAAPGLFDPETMPEETLPWIYPLCMFGYQHFSRLMKGNKVWLITNNDNINEYWYIPMPEQIEQSAKYLSENYKNNPDILAYRLNGAEESKVTLDDTNGLIEQVGKGQIHLQKDGNIHITSNNVETKLDTDKVYIGNKNDKYENAVLGNQLVDLLNELSSKLTELSSVSLANPYTSNLAPYFTQLSVILKSSNKILSKTTNIN